MKWDSSDIYERKFQLCNDNNGLLMELRPIEVTLSAVILSKALQTARTLDSTSVLEAAA